MLFIDRKKEFDHLSKAQPPMQMIELGILDDDLVTWKSSFILNQKEQLVIDGHNNEEREIEREILQGSPVSLILFLIYICRVFDKVLKTSPLVISLSFNDDLGFIASRSLVKEIVDIFENIAEAILE